MGRGSCVSFLNWNVEMNAIVKHQVDPVVRSNLDFKIEQIPTYWFANDPFRTRFFDALGLTFPEGERLFIESVRLYREHIQDSNIICKV